MDAGEPVIWAEGVAGAKTLRSVGETAFLSLKNCTEYLLTNRAYFSPQTATYLQFSYFFCYFMYSTILIYIIRCYFSDYLTFDLCIYLLFCSGFYNFSIQYWAFIIS